MSEEELAEKKIIQEANKIIVTSFYQGLFGDKDISVVDEYIDPSYVQHNPDVADGIDGIKASFIARNEGEGAHWFLEDKVDFQHVGAEDDRMFLHVKTFRDGKLCAVMDIFKLKDGKIIEHWDAFRVVPDIVKNSHPFF